MAVVTVNSGSNIRLNDCDTYTGFSNIGAGPGGSAEPSLKYQGTNACNRLSNNTAARRGLQLTNATSADMTVDGQNLWLCKVYVSDFADLNTTYGLEVRIGDASGDYNDYNIAGTGAQRPRFDTYNSTGGYLVIAIDPRVTAFTDTNQSTTLAAVDYFAAAAQFQNGNAKAENLAIDAIDIGSGLTLLGGDGADADGTFLDFSDFDTGNTNNRFGYAVKTAAGITFNGKMEIGTGSADTVFTDNNNNCFWPDGYHSTGSFGVFLDLTRAGTTASIGAPLTSGGTGSVMDTRADYVVSGSTGLHNFTGQISNFRNIIFSPAVTASNAILEAKRFEHSGSLITSCTFISQATSSEAMIQNFNSASFSDITIRQGDKYNSMGHAIQIDNTGITKLFGVSFVGFGDTASDSASLDIIPTSGEVTISIQQGGDISPTYKTAGASVLIQVPVFYTVTGAESGSEIRIVSTSGVELGGTEAVDTGQDFVYGYSYPGYNQDVYVVVHALDYEYELIDGVVLSTTDQELLIQQTFDRNYDNPA